MRYLWVGYLVTWIAVAGYAWRLARRVAEAEDRLHEARERAGSVPPAG